MLDFRWMAISLRIIPQLLFSYIILSNLEFRYLIYFSFTLQVNESQAPSSSGPSISHLAMAQLTGDPEVDKKIKNLNKVSCENMVHSNKSVLVTWDKPPLIHTNGMLVVKTNKKKVLCGLHTHIYFFMKLNYVLFILLFWTTFFNQTRIRCIVILYCPFVCSFVTELPEKHKCTTQQNLF